MGSIPVGATIKGNTMAKIKNEDYLRDATAICDRLMLVADLNKCSVSLIKIARSVIDQGDGRYAFDKASLADYMHDYCLMQMRLYEKND